MTKDINKSIDKFTADILVLVKKQIVAEVQAAITQKKQQSVQPGEWSGWEQKRDALARAYGKK